MPQRSEPADAREVSAYYERILPFYEIESAGRFDLAFWMQICRQFRPRTVLELGAGLGSVTSALAPLVDRMIGIDISIPMLARARRIRKPFAPVFVASDMRCLPFQSAFDLVVAPNDPFSHLTDEDDRRRVLDGVARVLRSSGRLVLDGLYLRRRAPLASRRRVAVPGGALSIREFWTPLAGSGRWEATYRYRLRTASGVREKSASFAARAWNPGEIVALLGSCGLAVESLWGSLAREPFLTSSSRLIVVAARMSESARRLPRPGIET